MKRIIPPLFLFISILVIAGCSTSQPRIGQALFAGCVDKVDDRATIKAGTFVCKGKKDPAPFGGNGRACGDCHMPGDGFGLSVKRISSLPNTHPLFYPGLDEDRKLLKSHGLVHVISGDIDEFRQTPKLIHLKKLCDEDGNCDALGLLGDRVRNLCAFSNEAVSNHMAKTVNRIPGKDFILPTPEECEALVAYMLSDLVANQNK